MSNDLLNIQDILRASDIIRWSTVRTIRKQSLAEHTFNVVMITRSICKLCGVDDAIAIKIALEHDLGEIMTGDIVSPTKARMREYGFDPNSVEPRGKNHSRDTVLGNAGTEVSLHAIVKAADYIEALWFIRENAYGRYAEEEVTVFEKYAYNYINSLTLMVRTSCFALLAKLEEGEYKRWLT